MGSGYLSSASRRSLVAFLPVHAGGMLREAPTLRRHQFFLDERQARLNPTPAGGARFRSDRVGLNSSSLRTVAGAATKRHSDGM